MTLGDQNNTTFHNSVRARQAQNTMREIICMDGSVAKQHSEIKAEAEKVFLGILNLVPKTYQGVPTEELRELFDFECSTKECRGLEADVTAEEIKKCSLLNAIEQISRA